MLLLIAALSLMVLAAAAGVVAFEAAGVVAFEAAGVVAFEAASAATRWVRAVRRWLADEAVARDLRYQMRHGPLPPNPPGPRVLPVWRAFPFALGARMVVVRGEADVARVKAQIERAERELAAGVPADLLDLPGESCAAFEEACRAAAARAAEAVARAERRGGFDFPRYETVNFRPMFGYTPPPVRPGGFIIHGTTD